MNQPLADSKRTKRRKNRKFIDLATSCRKHRRARHRQYSSNHLSNGETLKPGDKMIPKFKDCIYTGSGKLNYH